MIRTALLESMIGSFSSENILDSTDQLDYIFSEDQSLDFWVLEVLRTKRSYKRDIQPRYSKIQTETLFNMIPGPVL